MTTEVKYCTPVEVEPGKWVCKNPGCKFEARTSARPGKVVCPYIPKPPGMVRRAINFMGAQVSAITDVYTRVTKEQAEERRRVCKTNECQQYDAQRDICSKCGCNLSYKPEIRAWDCPLGYWPKIEHPKKEPFAIVPQKGGAYAWRGINSRKPWQYSVTAVIPVIEPDQSLVLVVELLRLQTERPYILLIDTGSSSDTCRWLETLRAHDVEIHYIRSHGNVHLSECVSMACDLGASRALTRFTFFTHADCFLMKQTAVADAMRLADKLTVAGHQITPRNYAGWNREVGHTFLMCDQDEMDRRGITWKMRRGVLTPGAIPDNVTDYTAENLPEHIVDTERSFNRLLRAAGIRPHFTGTEENWTRNTDEWIDHVRTVASAKLYGLPYYEKVKRWMPSAIADAEKRIQEWASR